MTYEVTFEKDTWYVGGTECSEEEAQEFIARRFNYVNMERAKRVMNSIRKGQKRR